MDKLFSCGQAIRNAAPGLTDDDVEEVLSAIIRRERAMPNRRGDALRWAEIAKEKAAEELEKLAIEKHARQAALLARVRRENLIGARDDKLQALSDLIATSERGGAGRAQSAEAAQGEARQAYLGAIVAAWDQAGVLPWMKRITPEDEAALAREIARQNGAPGVEATARTEIRKAAEAVVGVQRLMREEANTAGAWIRELPGRITRTAHDSRRMEQAGFEAWQASVLPKLDQRTWDQAGIDAADGAAVTRFLRNVFNNLVAGNHHVAARGELDPLSGFHAPGSLARRLSEDRVLHWKGPDDWLAYNREFGGGNLVSAIVGEAEHGARSIGLMRVWGPNPDAALMQDITRLADAARDAGDGAASERLSAAMQPGGKLWREWRTINGEGDRPVNRTAAHWMSAWRALETVTSLGGMVLSSIPDIATQASALRHEGISYWRTIAHQTAALLPQGPERREVAQRLAVGVNGLLGGLHNRLGYDISAPERISRGVNWFFKLNLQNWWQDAQERGLASMLSNHMADSLGRDWGGLDARFRASLERFGVTEGDWSAMRGAAPLEAGGERFWTPDLLPSSARETRQRIGAWFAETMNSGLTRPGVYERAILTQGQAPGTVLGEAMRLMTQFKSYPLTFLTTHWTRELHREGSADFAGLAGLIAGTTILGFAAMTLKDLAAGKNPREVEDGADMAKLVGRAFVQGGGLGIYGDFLHGEYNRFGGGLVETLGGPGFGTVAQIGRMFDTAVKTATGALDEEQRSTGNLPAQAVRFVARDVLPTNLFYAKLALDHMIIFRLQEAVNPGYLQRMERRLERDNNQTFWLPPTEALR